MEVDPEISEFLPSEIYLRKYGKEDEPLSPFQNGLFPSNTDYKMEKKITLYTTLIFYLIYYFFDVVISNHHMNVCRYDCLGMGIRNLVTDLFRIEDS